MIFEAACLFIGVISGLCSGLFGMGGGTIIVPFLLMLGASSHQAVGISVTQMVLASLIGSVLNIKKGKLDLKDGLLVALGGVIGGSFSGKLLELISSKTLSVIFLCLTTFLCLKFLFSRAKSDEAVQANPYKKPILVGSGALSGMFAIALGVGGGLILSPILGSVLKLGSKKIVPLALFSIIFASSAGLISFINEGLVGRFEITHGLIVAASSMCGVGVGIKLLDKMSMKLHKRILLCVFFAAILSSTFSLLRNFGVFG